MNSITDDIESILDAFHDYVPDKHSNRLVYRWVTDKSKWHKAHGLFTEIRSRTIKAGRKNDEIAETQYLFEEVIAKTLYNLTNGSAPFDADSPYWVVKNAIALSKKLDLEQSIVLNCMT